MARGKQYFHFIYRLAEEGTGQPDTRMAGYFNGAEADRIKGELNAWAIREKKDLKYEVRYEAK